MGDRVAYAMHTGSYAEKQAVPSWLLVRIPDAMDFATGSASLLQGMTAHFLVFGVARLNPGDQVLVHAGAGGMGLLLIQLLKRLGVHVFTTVSTRRERCTPPPFQDFADPTPSFRCKGIRMPSNMGDAPAV